MIDYQIQVKKKNINISHFFFFYQIWLEIQSTVFMFITDLNCSGHCKASETGLCDFRQKDVSMRSIQ